MVKKSFKQTLLLNIGAFILVVILETLSMLISKDNFDSNYSFMKWNLSYAIYIMGVIWINHFILIPYILDKKWYLLFGILLVGTIFLAASIRGYEQGKDFKYAFKMFFFLFYTTGSGMAAFFLRRNSIIKKENIEKERLQREIELKYLKEQVNPHFLFNSLNSIYALSRQKSPETPDLVMQLSELMRYQLESSKKDAVLLKEELEFIENYLLLEEKRLSKRSAIEFLIKGEFIGLKIAPMLLIPFVENAIKHGAQSTNEKSSIDVTVSVKNTQLNLIVENSKPSNTVVSDRKGLGLENVKRRLNLLYPDSYTLDILDQSDTFQVRLTIDLTVSTHKKK